MANNVENGDLNNLSKNECWNGKKTAIQVKIDCEATELCLTLLEDNWESLNDSKTSKNQIWKQIADGLEEVFIVRGQDKGNTCKTKWENMRKEYRSYLSKFQTGSAASDTKKPQVL
ncbi:hypothetical protein OUZ56_010728 [Daphnia magna]|uniref:Myb/SANT-like DNA-binding domain-containing protein n=1 Tax=Daphnia magna TaxID=35525 RepID=A0ABQ9YYG1_9CRUS|nr:hypothetical protein OUZ56_010728 [Daphnia magna]